MIIETAAVVIAGKTLMDFAAIDWEAISEGADWTTLLYIAITGIFALVGAWFGSWITYRRAMQIESTRRDSDRRDLLTALYCEMADRAARCLNDYLFPWRHYEDRDTETAKAMTASRAAKFRPYDPVILPQVSGRIGQLQPGVLAKVIQFYFRLESIRREIDNLTSDFEPNKNLTMGGQYGRVELVTRRFRDSLGPALEALEALPIENSEAFDDEAISTYEQINSAGLSLREGLRKFRRHPHSPNMMV